MHICRIPGEDEGRENFPGGPVVDFASKAGSTGSIPGQGAKIHIPHSQKIKQKQYCNKFNKDFKNVHIKNNNQKNKR